MLELKRFSRLTTIVVLSGVIVVAAAAAPATARKAAADTTAPTVSVTAPIQSATVSGTMTLTASASDNVGVTQVKWYVDGVEVAWVGAAPWTHAWNSATVANGTHRIFAKAADAAGNWGTSTELTFTVSNGGGTADTTPPTVSVTAPAAGATVSGTTNLTAAANDNVGVAQVKWYIDGAEVAWDGDGVPWTHTWNSATVANGTHRIFAKAADAAGNWATSVELSFTVSNGTTTSGDTTRPSTPTNFAAGTVTQTSIATSWTASTDNVAVAGYNVYVGTTKVNTSLVTGTSYTFASLTCGTTYSLAVEAVDTSGNVSATRASVSSSTSACTDTTPPSTPTNFVAGTKTQTSIATSWTASTDNVAVAGYNVYVGTTKVNTSLVTGTSYTFASLTCGTTYSLAVEAVDTSGHASTSRATMSTATSACSDTTPPSAPTNFAAGTKTLTSIATSWTASTDNVGVAGYNVYVGSTKVNTSLVTGTSYTFASLTCGTSYALGVEAVDAAGNVSTPRTTLSTSTNACTSTGIQHVVWVVMENHSYSQIIGNTTSAPYINSLALQYGNLTNMFAESHPSLPNYIAMTSGSTQGITDDSGPSSHLLNVANIFTQLGTGSRALEESMPSNCDKSDSGDYAVRHDPAVYYTNFTQCSTQVVPLGSTPDLSAKFTDIEPNNCHSMHSNSCAGSSDVIKQGDDWLRGFIPQLLATPQYLAGNTVIFVTWDEDNTCSGCTNRIPTIVISPSSAGKTSSTTFNHYSMLRYVEDTFGLSRIAGAASATSMSGAVGLP
jgi:chitodextrinase